MRVERKNENSASSFCSIAKNSALVSNEQMKLLSIIPVLVAVFMWAAGQPIEAELAMFSAIWLAVLGGGSK
jgi:hypothetical protein